MNQNFIEQEIKDENFKIKNLRQRKTRIYFACTTLSLLILLLLLKILISSQEQPGHKSQGAIYGSTVDWTLFNSSYRYKFFDQNLNWFEAKSVCLYYNSSMVENDEIYQELELGQRIWVLYLFSNINQLS